MPAHLFSLDPIVFIIVVTITFGSVGLVLLFGRKCEWCDTKTYFKKVCGDCQNALDGLRH